MAKLHSNEDKWNRHLEKHLSYHRRYGRINRTQLWNIIGEDALRLDKQLGIDMIEKLSQLIGNINKISKNENTLAIPEITANQFLPRTQPTFLFLCINQPTIGN